MNNKDISQFSLYEYWLFPLTRVPSSTSTPILFISYTYKYISFKIMILTLLKLMSVVFYIPHSCISDKNDFLNGVFFLQNWQFKTFFPATNIKIFTRICNSQDFKLFCLDWKWRRVLHIFTKIIPKLNGWRGKMMW